MQKKIVGGVVVVVLMGGAFWGGVQYEKGQAPGGGNGQYAAGGFGGPGGGVNGAGGARGSRGMNGGFISGSIVSSDAQSITVSLASGGSKVVYLSEATKVLKSTTGTKDDVRAGMSVMITGTPNQDGSVVAQSIQIRPDMPGRAPAGQ